MTKVEGRRAKSEEPGAMCDRALARSHVALLLSIGFEYPTEERFAALREELTALKATARFLASEVASMLDEVRSACKGLSRGLMETGHLNVFTHVIASDCDPCETAYTSTHLFQQAQRIADLKGFYLAFGVEPGCERPDHISVELEFMALLLQKEARAWQMGSRRKAAAARDAQCQFLEKHIGVWGGCFGRFLEIKGGDCPFEALARLLRAFLTAEAVELDARVKEVTGPPKPLPLFQNPEDEESDECPEFATAEQRTGSSPSNAEFATFVRQRSDVRP